MHLSVSVPRALLRIALVGVAVVLVSALFAKPAPAATKVRIAVQPVANMAPIPLGKRLGFFKQAGIDLEIVRGVTSVTIYPGVIRGDFQAGTSSWSALTIAVSQGLPVMGVAAMDRAGTNPKKDTGQIVVPKNSPIKTLADLKGKAIAVNATKNLTEIGPAEILRRKAKVTAKYVGVPFANMPAALRSGSVDAANAYEPFLTQMKREMGVRVLAGSNVEFYRDLAIGNIVMSRDWVNKNRAAAVAFKKAVEKSVRYAQRHQAAVRSILPTHSGITRELAQKVNLPIYDTVIPVRQINRIGVIFRNYGVIPKAPDMSKSVFTGK